MNAKELGAMSAHPITPQDERDICGGSSYGSAGLTKREVLAIAAMQGIRASMLMGRAEYATVSRMAVDQADSLLAELAKEQP